MIVLIYKSLCTEMASELRFALRCGSRQRPATKNRNNQNVCVTSSLVTCQQCSPPSTASVGRSRTRYSHDETTYLPSIEMNQLNGVSS